MKITSYQKNNSNFILKHLLWGILCVLKVEFATLSLEDGKPVNRVYTAQEVDELLAAVPIEKEEE
jgi:hypothetical protein